jgi:hypothetical protein
METNEKPIIEVVQVPQPRLPQFPQCPKCSSKNLWRDGLRYPMFGSPIQRWLCRDCGFRFSDPEDVKGTLKAFKQAEIIESKNGTSDVHENLKIYVAAKGLSAKSASRRRKICPRSTKQYRFREEVWIKTKKALLSTFFGN